MRKAMTPAIGAIQRGLPMMSRIISAAAEKKTVILSAKTKYVIEKMVLPIFSYFSSSVRFSHSCPM